MRTRLIYKIHLWSGLVGVLLLFLQAVSGLIIEFRPELHRVLHPTIDGAPTRAPRLPVRSLTDIANARYPNLQVERVILPATPRDPVWLRLAPGGRSELPHFVLLNPVSGQVLQAGTLFSFPCELALYLHATLLAGHIGEVLVGVEGLALLLLAITGSILWWPGVRRALGQIRVRRGQPRVALLLDLHKLLGICACAGLFVLASSGVGLAFDSFLPTSWAPFLGWLRSVHTGTIAGLPGRLVMFVFGCGLVAVTITGAWLWLEREQMRRTHARRCRLARAGSSQNVADNQPELERS